MLSTSRTLLHGWSLRIEWESQTVRGAVARILTSEEAIAHIYHSKYSAICCIGAVPNGFDIFDLFFDFEINNLRS